VVAAGHSIVVALIARNFQGGLPGAPTCSDMTNGTYTVEVTQPDGGFLKRLTVCSKHNAAALASGSQISISWSAAPPPTVGRWRSRSGYRLAGDTPLVWR